MNFCGTIIKDNILGEFPSLILTSHFILHLQINAEADPSLPFQHIIIESTKNFELEDAWKDFDLPELLFFLARNHVDRRG